MEGYPGIFSDHGDSLQAGRDFDLRGIADAPPYVVVDETLVRRDFPQEDPIGKRIMVKSYFCRMFRSGRSGYDPK